MANEAGGFDFWLRFGSVTGFSNLLLRQRPVTGTTRQKSKLPAPNGYSFS
jgi:hypothetical protein